MHTHNPTNTYPPGFLEACESIGLDPDTEAARHSLAVWDAIEDRSLDAIDDPDAYYSRSVGTAALWMEHGPDLDGAA